MAAARMEGILEGNDNSGYKSDRGRVVLGLVGIPRADAGSLDVVVDRSSVLGNPFYDAWPVAKWSDDCLAYKRYLTLAVAADNSISDSAPLLECAKAASEQLKVQISDRWRRRPPLARDVRAEIEHLRIALRQGRVIRLLCHCARPFKELNGQYSPCHAESIADELDPVFDCVADEMSSEISRLEPSSEPPHIDWCSGGSAAAKGEQFVAFVFDCLGSREECGPEVDAFLRRFPHIDPYRGRRGYSELSSLPGGIAVYPPDTGQQGVIALFCQLHPGPPVGVRGSAGSGGSCAHRHHGEAAAYGNTRGVGGISVNDSESERLTWFRGALGRVLRIQDLKSLALLADNRCIPSGPYSQIVNGFARAAAVRGVTVAIYSDAHDNERLQDGRGHGRGRGSPTVARGNGYNSRKRPKAMQGDVALQWRLRKST
eukprot:TRINITY_DN60730_c0_g1_i1.p1 TRINITY_DN60730_c0_g1~~TRINITY_DN60730_c0_g1_i1.p1  ORF type:complete len:429 (-),score=37.77 TRINITY_DN60730_c0_g1_i1:339-1625(-)